MVCDEDDWPIVSTTPVQSSWITVDKPWPSWSSLESWIPGRLIFCRLPFRSHSCRNLQLVQLLKSKPVHSTTANKKAKCSKRMTRWRSQLLVSPVRGGSSNRIKAEEKRRKGRGRHGWCGRIHEKKGISQSEKKGISQFERDENVRPLDVLPCLGMASAVSHSGAIQTILERASWRLSLRLTLSRVLWSVRWLPGPHDDPRAAQLPTAAPSLQSVARRESRFLAPRIKQTHAAKRPVLPLVGAWHVVGPSESWLWPVPQGPGRVFLTALSAC